MENLLPRILLVLGLVAGLMFGLGEPATGTALVTIGGLLAAWVRAEVDCGSYGK